MSVRAKFRCNSIKLTQTSVYTPEFQALIDEYNDYVKASNAASVRGVEQYRPFDQPSVELLAVTASDGSEENKAFFSATPTAKIEMTISNPDAAETFELGKHYYVDFSPAD